ncbi:MAG: putative cytokinetic ring protein SteA [Anaerobacillus sp.]|uniref:putative cytokinetic ring protein SteA n=1 Tax=Anaerobacillus sp. TaxID=1872506 RepID=UPI00391B3730
MLSNDQIKGYAYQDKKTKLLVERIPKKSIAVVVHQDIDMAAAEKLISCRVKAVINFKKSMSGLFVHNGVEVLLDAKIPVFDIEEDLEDDLEGKLILVKEDHLFEGINGSWVKVCKLSRYSYSQLRQLKLLANTHFAEQFKKFVGNSLDYGDKELDQFIREVENLPVLRQFLGKEVLIVARGANYERDLMLLKPFIKKKRFITIAVDGGADGLMKIGVKPDYIIGDMDSVSEKSLRSGAQLLVHAYRDGRSPGEGRIISLNLPSKRIALLGTSEDAAITYAYCSGARKIYTVGTRLGMNEFLEKGRIGMGSSLLTRMKVSHALVDLKGIHSLFVTESDRGLSGWVLIPAILVLGLMSLSERFELFVSLVFQWWGGG